MPSLHRSLLIAATWAIAALGQDDLTAKMAEGQKNLILLADKHEAKCSTLTSSSEYNKTFTCANPAYNPDTCSKCANAIKSGGTFYEALGTKDDAFFTTLLDENTPATFWSSEITFEASLGQEEVRECNEYLIRWGPDECPLEKRKRTDSISTATGSSQAVLWKDGYAVSQADYLAYVAAASTLPKEDVVGLPVPQVAAYARVAQKASKTMADAKKFVDAMASAYGYFAESGQPMQDLVKKLCKEKAPTLNAVYQEAITAGVFPEGSKVAYLIDALKTAMNISTTDLSADEGSMYGVRYMSTYWFPDSLKPTAFARAATTYYQSPYLTSQKEGCVPRPASDATETSCDKQGGLPMGILLSPTPESETRHSEGNVWLGKCSPPAGFAPTREGDPLGSDTKWTTTDMTDWCSEAKFIEATESIGSDEFAAGVERPKLEINGEPNPDITDAQRKFIIQELEAYCCLELCQSASFCQTVLAGLQADFVPQRTLSAPQSQSQRGLSAPGYAAFATLLLASAFVCGALIGALRHRRSYAGTEASLIGEPVE